MKSYENSSFAESVYVPAMVGVSLLRTFSFVQSDLHIMHAYFAQPLSIVQLIVLYSALL